MKSITIKLIIVAVLSVIALAIWSYARQRPAQVPPPPAEEKTTQQPVRFMEGRIVEEADIYRIDLKYPQFGIPSIDTPIENHMRKVIVEFAADAPEELVTSAPYELTSQYDRLYIGSDVISARLFISSYMGGAHPNTGIMGLNYDAQSGRAFTLDDALAFAGLSLEQVAQKADEELSEKLGDAYFSEGTAPERQNYETFLIDQDSVTFIFQLYQAAPYAAGPQEVSFPRTK